MVRIKYVTGDLFDLFPYTTPTHKIIPHICNDLGAWGSGFVVPLGNKWPEAKLQYKQWFKSKYAEFCGESFALGNFQSVRVQVGGVPQYAGHESGPIFVLNMIAQVGVIRPDNPRPINYAALGHAMHQIGQRLAKSRENGFDPEIHCPCFGAGLAGGNWDFIELLIHDAWVRQGIPVTVYQLPGQEVRDPTAEEDTDG